MAKVHAKNTVFKLDSAAGSLVDLSSWIDNVGGLPGATGQSAVTAFSDGGDKTVPGLESASITISGSWDGASAAIDEHLAAIRGHANTQTVEYGPSGSTSGMIKYSCEVRLATYTVASAVADKVSFTATLQVQGVVTRGTWT